MIVFMHGGRIHERRARAPCALRASAGVSRGVSERITTRFGALDERLARAVRHALDVAVTFSALTRLNDVHLRIVAMVDVVDADLQIGEPPSHNWHELMTEIFGHNSVGTRRSPVGLRVNRPNDATLESIKVAASHELSPRENQTIHDLLAAASAFIVAESTSLARTLKETDLADRPSYLTADLYATLQQAGQVGVRLAETAASGAWASLLTDRPAELAILPSPRSMATVDSAERVRAMHSLAQSRPRLDDHVVCLVVDPMEKSQQRVLAKQGLMTILESWTRRRDEEPRTLFVMSTVSDSSPVPVALNEGDDAGPYSPFREPDRWFAQKLEQVSQAVDTFDHSEQRTPRPADDRVGERGSRDSPDVFLGPFFEAITVALRDYSPRLVVVLANDTSISQRFDVMLDSCRGPDVRPSSTAARLKLRLALHGASVAVISGSPPRAGLDSLLEAWSAAGATVQYRCLVQPPRDLDLVNVLIAGSVDKEQVFPSTSSVDETAPVESRSHIPLITESRDRGLRPPPSRTVRLRVFTMVFVFIAAMSVTSVTVLAWGIDTFSNILGLAAGLSSGAALAWSARQWRKLETSGSLKQRLSHMAKAAASNGLPR